MFGNPGFLTIALLAISVPIIIHLIHRMRFKRIRWAAMEFLLKAQKKSQKRLIIEQIILLLLRCFLVALAGFLVLRFQGCRDTTEEDVALSTKRIHYVLIDDSLSMNDTNPARGKSVLDYAREAIIKRVGEELRRPKQNDEVIVIPASKVHSISLTEPGIQELQDEGNFNKFKEKVNAVAPTLLPADLGKAVTHLAKNLESIKGTQFFLHIASDFRSVDWNDERGKELHKTLQDLADKAKVKVHLIDAADWEQFPNSSSNLAITDFRPLVRVAPRQVPVSFVAEIKNFGSSPVNVRFLVIDGVTGLRRTEIKLPPQPMLLQSKATEKIRFDAELNYDLKEGPSKIYSLVAKIEVQNAHDGLEGDNTRATTVEVRNKAQLLILDGDANTDKDERDLDSIILAKAILSIKDKGFEIVWGDKIAGSAVKALEQGDLTKYSAILICNVPKFSPLQQRNLEDYVKAGGGVAFFMGPNVQPEYYNKNLYAGGAGLFPAPLKLEYTPGPKEKKREPPFTGEPQLLIRHDRFPPGEDSFPIFGKIDRSLLQTTLTIFQMYRYFEVDREKWTRDSKQVFELATLPNETPAHKMTLWKALMDDPNYKSIIGSAEFQKYEPGFTRYDAAIEKAKEKQAQHLSYQYDALLADSGRADDPLLYPNMVEFWSSSDPRVEKLKAKVMRDRDELRYGDPLVLGRTYGNGKVIATMTSAGKVWHDWFSHELSARSYHPFVSELLDYLSTSTNDRFRSLGQQEAFVYDKDAFQGRTIKLDHQLVRFKENEPQKAELLGEINAEKIAAKKAEQDEPEEEERMVFRVLKNDKPGLAVFTPVDVEAPGKKPGAPFWYVYNVDPTYEGALERINPTVIDHTVITPERKAMIGFVGSQSTARFDFLGIDAVKKKDSAEDPWVYLIIFMALILEQAMAVHLSYHLKENDHPGLARMMQPGAK